MTSSIDPSEGAIDPAAWGIVREGARDSRSIGGRVSKRVGDEWMATIARIAEERDVAKGSVWDAGLLIAMHHEKEWQDLVGKAQAGGVNADTTGTATPDV